MNIDFTTARERFVELVNKQRELESTIDSTEIELCEVQGELRELRSKVHRSVDNSVFDEEFVI